MNKILKFVILLSFLLSFNSLALAEDDYDDEFAAFEAEFSSSNNTESGIYDPFESFNRRVYNVNGFVDKHTLDPLVKNYRKMVPTRIRKSVHNFVTNISLPISTFNSLLQGKLNNSLSSFSTFLINSTIGVFGLFDVAGSKGIKYNFEDFGQTLAYYGVPDGPYLLLPILGPSNIRDVSGMLVDNSIDINGFDLLQLGGSSDDNIIDEDFRFVNFVASSIDRRESLIEVIDSVRNDSIDQYATTRSLYFQNRKSEIAK